LWCHVWTKLGESESSCSGIYTVNCGTSMWAQTFNYDPFGNINKVNNGNATTYNAQYNTATNQVSSLSTLPSYDKNGNQTNLTAISASIAWNGANQPVTINGTTATYDAFGRMVETGSGSTWQQYVFRPSGAQLGVYSGALTKGTIPLPGGATAVYNSSGLNYIRHKDWLGSSRLGTNWNHTVYSKVAYAPFGETESAGAAGTPDRSFTGQDQDVVTGSGGTGVYDFLFRKYDPSAGRWLSPDPSGWGAVDQTTPQSLNRYAYVRNNPLSLVDPEGLYPIPCPDSGTLGGQSGAGSDDTNGYVFYVQSCDNHLPGPPPAPSIDTCDEDPGFCNMYQLDYGGKGWTPGPTGPQTPNDFSPARFAMSLLLASKLGGLPSCKGLDIAGDAIGVTGAAGVVVTSVSIAVIVLSGGTATPVVIAVDAGFGAAWATGYLMNTAAKYGIGCW
jgi:RHS repeat-associated protein